MGMLPPGVSRLVAKKGAIFSEEHKRQIEKDERGQQEITEHLNCEFIILWI